MTRTIIIGGSLGGLTAALTLRDIGCDVLVYERAPTALLGQGAGIVLNPVTVRYLVERRGLDLAAISVRAGAVRYLDRHGAVAHEQAASYRFSSYNALYRGLLDALEPERYKLATTVASFSQDSHGVTVQLAGGGTQRAELLVCADGVRSGARKFLLPHTGPRYAGYVAWRGTVAPSALGGPHASLLGDAITYHLRPDGHMLIYPIPMVDQVGASDAPHLNWLWYRNAAAGPALDGLLTDRTGQRRDVSVPAGAVAEAQLAQLRADAASLPPPLATLVAATTQPFVQAIVDVEIPHMAFGRVCLVGDAAVVARPHAAAGSAKAAADAWALAEALAASAGDVQAALARWEPGQLALGRSVLARTREAGDRMQFTQSWPIGAALPFGLYRVGDSEL